MRSIHKRFEKPVQMVRELTKKLADWLLPPDSFGFGLVPAYAGVSNIRPEFRMPTVIEFHTAEPPSVFSPSRKIMDWESIDILYPDEITEEKKKKGNFITHWQAQKEVARILRDRSASHEYIAYEAARLCQDSDIARYTLHLMIGALGEDFVFSRGEGIDSLYAEPPKRAFVSDRQLASAVWPDSTTQIPSLFGGLFDIAAMIWGKIMRKPEKDKINRPYFAHFYDPTREEGDTGLSILHGDIKFKSALDRIRFYWRIASEFYASGDKSRAFYALGHLIHIVQDLHVPAHTHNDIHGPTVFLGRSDSYEGWAARTDHPHVKRKRDKPNIRIWDSGPLGMPESDHSWRPDNVDEKITAFVNSIVLNTQRFRSVDREGTDPNQRRKGRLTDEECFRQSSELIPAAIFSSAQFIVNFLDYHRRIR